MPKTTSDPEFLSQLTFEPLSKSNWPKFVQLFGEKGACGNCWCMYYRLKKADWTEGKADDGNKDAMHELVRENRPTGILGFFEGQPIAWAGFEVVDRTSKNRPMVRYYNSLKFRTSPNCLTKNQKGNASIF